MSDATGLLYKNVLQVMDLHVPLWFDISIKIANGEQLLLNIFKNNQNNFQKENKFQII